MSDQAARRATSTALLAVLGVCLTTSRVAYAFVSPSSFELEVYRFAVSTTGDCANPIVVFSNEQPSFLDLASDPTLGAGQLNDGVYGCVMIEMAPVIHFVPASSEGACVSGTEYTASACGVGLLEDPDAGFFDAVDGGISRPVQNLDGTSADCSSSSRIVLYLSQWSAGGTTTAKPFNPFQPPATAGDGASGILLAGSLVVSGGAQVGTFIVEAQESIYSDGPTCSLSPPKFIFAPAPVDEDASAGPPQK